MSGTKRKVLGAALKAKVGLEAIHGIKTLNQIAQENGVHPVRRSGSGRRRFWSAQAPCLKANGVPRR